MNDEQAELTRSVEAISATISASSNAGDRERRLDEGVYEALRSQDLFSLLIPAALGGREVDPISVLSTWEAVGRLDPATGWNLAQTSTGIGMSARLGREGIDEIYGGSRNPVFAGAIAPVCKAVATNNGYSISGQVPFVSGCHHADWFYFMIVPMVDGRAQRDPETGSPMVMTAFVPSRDVQILDTWHTLGMRGTGSADVVLDDVIVPRSLTAVRSAGIAPSSPFSGPLYRLHPWLSIFGEAVTSIAIAAEAIVEITEFARTKTSANTRTPIGEREYVQLNVGRARALVESARAYLHQSMGTAFASASAGGDVPIEEKVSMQLAACHAAESCRIAVDLVCEAAGTASIRTEGRLERLFRDIHVAQHHATKSMPRYISAGRIMLGLESDVSQLSS